MSPRRCDDCEGTAVSLRRSVAIATFAGVLALLAACARPEVTSWQEDVQLSDGRTIRVAREVVWRTTHPMGESKIYMTAATTMRPSADRPVTALPEWKGNGEMLLLLDVDEQTKSFLLVTYPATCPRFNAGGRPDPPYFEYRVRAGKWEPVPFSPALAGRSSNMYVSPDWAGERALVDVSYKQSLATKLRPQQRVLVPEGPYGSC
jgi:hypothetical protein